MPAIVRVYLTAVLLSPPSCSFSASIIAITANSVPELHLAGDQDRLPSTGLISNCDSKAEDDADDILLDIAKKILRRG